MRTFVTQSALRSAAKSTSVFLAFSGVVALTLSGCSGGTGDAQSSSEYSDDEFVGDSSTVGGLTLEVKDPVMGVGDTSGFFVRVTNQDGQPVPSVQITCDTEQGVAIIEPTTGAEITDSFGSISGVIGCAAPGSYQMACRLPIGGNKRQFANIKCEGPIPVGFDGFPGAGGGGLGTGGSAVEPEGGLRLIGVGISDTGVCGSGANTTSIDIRQDDCDASPTVVDLEQFFDTSGSFQVLNDSTDLWTFKRVQYSVPNVNGSTFISDPIAIQGEVLPNGGTASFCTILFDANNGGKRFAGASANISITGFRNVTFRLVLENQSGEEITLTSSVALSFDNFDRC